MFPVMPEPRPEASPLVIAKDQKEYQPLPANYCYPYIETKWRLSWRERLSVLLSGHLYLTLMTFGRPLQPIRMDVTRMEDMEQ